MDFDLLLLVEDVHQEEAENPEEKPRRRMKQGIPPPEPEVVAAYFTQEERGKDEHHRQNFEFRGNEHPDRRPSTKGNRVTRMIASVMNAVSHWPLPIASPTPRPSTLCNTNVTERCMERRCAGTSFNPDIRSAGSCSAFPPPLEERARPQPANEHATRPMVVHPLSGSYPSACPSRIALPPTWSPP